MSTSAWIMDLISIVDGSGEAETGGRNKGGLRFGADGESGLCVDFNTKIGSFRSIMGCASGRRR